MIRFSLFVAIGLAASAAAAHPAMTAEPATMRAAPSSHARALQDIPANAQIDVEECRDRWCAASWRNLEGYVRVEAIGAPHDGPLVDAPPPPYGYYGGPVLVGPGFGFGYYRRRYW
jgi:uncharacterized protein YraI